MWGFWENFCTHNTPDDPSYDEICNNWDETVVPNEESTTTDESPDFGEGGSYFDEFAQPDTRTAEELFPWDFENWENAWAGNECEIENMFNSQREANGLAEIHDPDCNKEWLEEDLGRQLDDLNS